MLEVTRATKMLRRGFEEEGMAKASSIKAQLTHDRGAIEVHLVPNRAPSRYFRGTFNAHVMCLKGTYDNWRKVNVQEGDLRTNESKDIVQT